MLQAGARLGERTGRPEPGRAGWMRRLRRMLGRTTAPSLSLAPTDAHDRRPADPDFPRRWSRRRRAAARPHHLHRAAARRRDHPRRPRHRRDPGRRAVAEPDELLLVPPARPLGVARRLAGVAGGTHDAVRAGGLARGHRRHRGRARLRQGAGIADPPQPQRQAEPVAVPARPGLAVPGRGGRAWVAGRGGAADAAPGPARDQPRQAREPGRSGERQVSLRTGAVLVGWRSIAWRTPVAQADRPFLLDHFSALQDPRQQAKVLYPLPEILLLLLCATLAGADDVVEIALWGDEHLAFLRRFLPCKHGGRSHDTLGEVLAALDPGLFKACFMSWVEGLREAEPDLIAIDGKTSRRSHARSKGRGPLHLVSAWATRQRLVLGQEAVAGKSNEIAAIPLLLERLALDGALVTIDAIGAQGAIAEVILERGGDYLLALKRNRPATFDDEQAFLADPPAVFYTFEATDGDHGRIEVRRHAVCHDVAWLLSDRRYPGEVAFPGLAMIGMVESETERGGKTGRERRYFLGSARLDAATFARAVRGQWGIENRLHWVLDVVCRDDLARLRTGHGPANMAVVRHMAVNLLRQAKPTVSTKNRRKRAGWNTGYLESLIRQAA